VPIPHGHVSGAGAAAKLSTEPRRYDTVEADELWIQSGLELKVARYLKEGDYFSTCVWHCQQSSEMAIKSLMLRTCGITVAEMRGKGAHNLVKLVERIVEDGHAWPLSQVQLQELSGAYLSARYPRGSQSPAARYTVIDAATALETATLMCNWVNGAVDEDGGEVAKSRQDDAVSFEPAPLPPAPPPPSPPPLPPPPPQSVSDSAGKKWVPVIGIERRHSLCEADLDGKEIQNGSVDVEDHLLNEIVD
jgi:HEPN domain-containing protein